MRLIYVFVLLGNNAEERPYTIFQRDNLVKTPKFHTRRKITGLPTAELAILYLKGFRPGPGLSRVFSHVFSFLPRLILIIDRKTLDNLGHCASKLMNFSGYRNNMTVDDTVNFQPNIFLLLDQNKR